MNRRSFANMLGGSLLTAGIGSQALASTTKSKSLYAAGYFIIRFEKGWVKSFCPKMITLDRYESKGPFKTDIIMRTELSRVNAK